MFKTSVGASYYKGSLAGTHNFKFGFEWGDSYNPYIYQINQGINAQYQNGAAVEVMAFNTPLPTRHTSVIPAPISRTHGLADGDSP